MKKDFLLVLCFYEGQGFCPKIDHNIAVSARIDGHVLSTDPVPLTSEPKFCTEVSWQVDSQTLRRYKLSRVPVRVECYSVDKRKEKHSLGYIILTLSSVVQGIETDPKWYKLLGGKLIQAKNPPQILISMNLQSEATNGKVKNNTTSMFHNGKMNGGIFNMSPVGNAVGKPVVQQNGAPHPMQSPNGNLPITLSIQDSLQRSDFEALSKLGVLLSENSQLQRNTGTSQGYHIPSSEVEDIGVKVDDDFDYDVEDDYSPSQDVELEDDEDVDPLFEIGEVFSESKKEEELSNEVVTENQDSEKVQQTKPKSIPPNNSQTSDYISCNGGLDYKSKFVPASPIERARSLLDYCSVDNRKNQDGGNTSGSRIRQGEFAALGFEEAENNIQFRVSGHSKGLSKSETPSFHKIDKNESMETLASRRPVGPLLQTGVDFRDKHLSNIAVSSTISRDIAAGASASEARPSAENADHLVPRLNHEGGYFQIGREGDSDEMEFELAVTVVFAKNLDQLLPSSFKWNANSETCFSYSLMGCVINTEPIKDLHSPDFLADRATGRLRATVPCLCAYFKKNAEFPIHLLLGDLCLASTSINLEKFQELSSNTVVHTPIVIEGWYPLLSVISDSANVMPGKEPMLGAIVELSGTVLSSSLRRKIPSPLSISEASSDSEDLSEIPYFSKQRFGTRRKSYSQRGHWDVSSSSSDEEMIPSRKRQRGSSHHRRPSRENVLIADQCGMRALSKEKRRLKKHLYKAALEVESWKEGQQNMFLKQWSAREAELQRHLADEWKAKLYTMESSLRGLHNHMEQTDVLHERLTSALSKLSVREKKLCQKEEKVHKLLEELEQRQNEQEETERGTLQGRLIQRERKEHEALLQELKEEKEMRTQLEVQNSELKFALAAAEMPVHHQHEMKQQLDMLEEERESLMEALSKALKKKQYYKVMWVRSINDLHQVKKSRFRDIEALRSEVEISSPEPFYVHPHPHHKKRRERSHTIEVGNPMKSPELRTSSSKFGRRSDTLFSTKRTDERISKSGGETHLEPSCSWAGLQGRRDKIQTEPRNSGLSGNKKEPTSNTAPDKRTAVGKTNIEESNDEAFEKLLRNKNLYAWRAGATQPHTLS
ncbi:hypothetical protein SK128_021248 [Halocaridina rubra]|uniref:C2 domain-containing protein n=1 Tax=Halocaridina rubra TaxID=373956 RepID=A0AAN8XTQ1_HALRR